MADIYKKNRQIEERRASHAVSELDIDSVVAKYTNKPLMSQ